MRATITLNRVNRHHLEHLLDLVQMGCHNIDRRYYRNNFKIKNFIVPYDKTAPPPNSMIFKTLA
jgi:hypothetical protein